MPFFPMPTKEPRNITTTISSAHHAAPDQSPDSDRLNPPASVQAKNRRKRYLDQHPEYFSADLEMTGVYFLCLCLNLDCRLEVSDLLMANLTNL